MLVEKGGSQNINQACVLMKKTYEKWMRGKESNMVKRGTDAIRLSRTMNPAHLTLQKGKMQ